MTDLPSNMNEILDSMFYLGPLAIYTVIFLACFIENIIPPFPGDSFILAAGVLVSLSRLQLLPTMVAVVGGGLSSVMLLYFLGNRYGRSFFQRRKYRFFSIADIDRIESQLDRYGALILVFSRFAVGIRAVLALVAGISRYHAPKMFLYSLISYLIFSSLLIYMAMALVDNFDRIAGYIKAYNYVAWTMVSILVTWYVVRAMRRQKNAREQG